MGTELTELERSHRERVLEPEEGLDAAAALEGQTAPKPEDLVKPPTPLMRLDATMARRFFSANERVQELRNQIIDSELMIHMATKTKSEALRDMQPALVQWQTVQQQVAKRFGLDGQFTVTPDGVVIPQSVPQG